MLLNTTQFDGMISNIGVQKNFGFASNGKAFRTLFDTLYQDKIGSIVREVSCNAYDAHIFAGKSDLPFEIHLPSIMEPFFSVKDYGIGMDEDTIGEVFTIMFASTKDTSNIGVGGFGLGSKTPFAYTDNFTVISTKDGIRSSYTMYIAQDGTPGYVKLSDDNTSESNGVEIIIPVNDLKDRRSFADAIVNQLHFFPLRPIIKGGDYGINWMVEPDDSKASLIHNNIKFFSGNSLTGSDRRGCFAVVGPVGYELNFRILREKLPQHEKIINWLDDQNIRIHFNIGEVSVTPSRETMSYDPMTIAAFDNRFNGLIDELTKQYRADFNACATLVDKALFMSQNASWSRKLVEKSFYDIFDKSIFKRDYSGNYNLIDGQRIADQIGHSAGWSNVTFTMLDNVTSAKKQRGLSAELRFNTPNLTFCIIDVSRLAERRVITATATLNASVTHAISVNRQALDDATYTLLINKTKELLESYGFTVHLLSTFAPAKVERDYSAVKTHGYRVNTSADFKNGVGTTLSGSNHWEKLVSKSDIEPGFYVQSHYGNIEHRVSDSVTKLLQLKAFKMLPKELQNLDIFAMPIKACEKLQADDGWINLREYIANVADVNIAELCHDVWVADTIKSYIAELNNSSKYALQIFDQMLPLRTLFNELKALVIDNEIMLSGYDEDTLKMMVSMKPQVFHTYGRNISSKIYTYVVEVFKKFPLLPTRNIFTYDYMNHDPIMVAEYMEYIKHFNNLHPERLDNYPVFDVSLIMAEFPPLPTKVVKEVVEEVAEEMMVEAI